MPNEPSGPDSPASHAELFERIALGVAHDFRNPLAVILNGLYLLRRGAAGQTPRDVEILDSLNLEVREANRLIGNLIDAARRPAPQAVDAAELMRAACAALPGAARGGSPEVLLPQPFAINADPAQIQQVFAAILNRLSRGAPAASRLVIRGDHSAGEDRIVFEVAVPGAPPSGPEPEPGGSARRESVSLALLICRHVVEMHGGRFDYFSHSGAARATINLPQATAP